VNDFTQIHHHPVRLHWTYSSGSLPARLVRPIFAFFRLGYELSYGWLEAPQAHVSSMRATRLLYLSSQDVEEGVHFSSRHAQKSIHFNRTHIPQPPFPFHRIFHIFSLLHSPNTMIHGVHPFSPSPDQTYCVFRGVSGMWRVVVLCIRWVLFWFCLGGWCSCTCHSCIIPREQSWWWTATEPISMFSVSILLLCWYLRHLGIE